VHPALGYRNEVVKLGGKSTAPITASAAADAHCLAQSLV